MEIGIYIHWPFCISKCAYCDFNSFVIKPYSSKQWLKAYINQFNYLAHLAQAKNYSLVSIFFGGGTPSLMPPELCFELIEHIKNFFKPATNIEISLEANPQSFDRGKFLAFRDAGINRLSIGVQSLNEEELKFLTRKHSAQEAIATINWAQQFFTNYSLDFIYALPNHNLQNWQEKLNYYLTFINQQASFYQLTIEPNTGFFYSYNKKLFSLPQEDLAYQLYCLTEETLKGAHIPAYEISNYGKKCRHNCLYWQYKNYLGIGPGAHSRLSIEQIKHQYISEKMPKSWLNYWLENTKESHNLQALSMEQSWHEFLLMNLRLIEGINMENFKPYSLVMGKNFYKNLNYLEKYGLVSTKNGILNTTLEGRLKLNAIIEYLLK